MHNRKRSLICASELAVAGTSPIVYLHALSPGDWKIVEEFLRGRPEVNVVAKEFQTSGVDADHRGKIRAVAQLEQRLGRGLHLVAVGGGRMVPDLQRHVSAWTVVDATPYMKTVKGRRRASRRACGDSRLDWIPDYRSPLDVLLSHNLTEYQAWIDRLALRHSRAA